MESLPAFSAAWLLQRRAGAEAVAEIEREELRFLDDADALRMSEALLDAAPIAEMVAARVDTSGFVEQQRLFHRRR